MISGEHVIANPALFRLIFASSAQLLSDGEIEALDMLRANVAAALPDEARTGEQEVKALRAWAVVHGLTMLMLDRQLPANEELIDRLVG